MLGSTRLCAEITARLTKSNPIYAFSDGKMNSTKRYVGWQVTLLIIKQLTEIVKTKQSPVFVKRPIT